MRSGKRIGIIILAGLLSALIPYSPVSARDIKITQTCNVKVTFTATVPDSVEQGDSFTIKNITVSPASSYGFTVTSSTYDLTATNTSSTTYHQSFAWTDPSPTTGHSTYVGHYPNWTLNATGAVGSYVTVTIKKSVTIVQGYGTVRCDFKNKEFLKVPIVAPKPAPSQSPSPSSSPSSSPSASPSGGVKPSGSATPKPSDSASATPKPGAKPGATNDPTPSTPGSPDSTDAEEEGITVVPLIIKVRDASGNIVPNAEVTLDGSNKMKTDSKGQVTFSNVLTGSHSLLVLHKGKKVSHSIHVDTKDVGTAVVVSLPADPLIVNPFVVGAITAGTVGFGAPLALFAIRRMRKKSDLGDLPAHAVSLHGIIAGSANEKPTNRPLVPVPAIPVFSSQPAVPSPAPWNTVQLVPPASSEPATAPATPAAPAAPAAPGPVRIPVTEPAVVAPEPVQPAPAPQPSEPSPEPLPTIQKFAPDAPAVEPVVPAVPQTPELTVATNPVAAPVVAPEPTVQPQPLPTPEPVVQATPVMQQSAQPVQPQQPMSQGTFPTPPASTGPQNPPTF